MNKSPSESKRFITEVPCKFIFTDIHMRKNYHPNRALGKKRPSSFCVGLYREQCIHSKAIHPCYFTKIFKYTKLNMLSCYYNKVPQTFATNHCRFQIQRIFLSQKCLYYRPIFFLKSLTSCSFQCIYVLPLERGSLD